MVPTTLVEQAHFDYDQEECLGMLLELPKPYRQFFGLIDLRKGTPKKDDGNDLTENLMAYVKNYSVFLVLQYSNYY